MQPSRIDSRGQPGRVRDGVDRELLEPRRATCPNQVPRRSASTSRRLRNWPPVTDCRSTPGAFASEAGLDFRVAFARAGDGTDWVLRIPRRPDVSAKLAEERRILEFVGPRLSVAVPRWEVCSEELVAYRRLPGAPGLTLDASGQPIWHFEPSSPEFAAAMGRLIAELHAIDADAAREAGVPVLTPPESSACSTGRRLQWAIQRSTSRTRA